MKRRTTLTPEKSGPDCVPDGHRRDRESARQALKAFVRMMARHAAEQDFESYQNDPAASPLKPRK